MASHSSSGSSFEPIGDNQSIDLSRKSIEEAIEDDLSFVLTENIDDDKTSGEEMSQSKYSQVISIILYFFITVLSQMSIYYRLAVYNAPKLF